MDARIATAPVSAPQREGRALPYKRGAVAEPAELSSDSAMVASLVKRHRRALAAGAAVVVLILLGLGYGFYRLSRRPARQPGAQMQFTQLTTSGKVDEATISPDGKYVAYVQRDPNGMSLWLYQVATGSSVQIISGGGEDVLFGGPTFSNDGNYVYYVRTDKNNQSGELYKVASLGGTPLRLFDNLQSAVTLSPDGKRLAFCRWHWDRGVTALMTAGADGQDQRQLFEMKQPDQVWGGLAWSPDGRVIAMGELTRVPSRKAVVLAVSVEDGLATPIGSHGWTTFGRPAWLPDGSGLVMPAAELNSPAQGQIYELTYPEGEVRRITNDPNNYLGIGITADSRALVTMREDVQAKLWVSAKPQWTKFDEVPASGKDNGANGLD